jgi:hypothetical protein
VIGDGAVGVALLGAAAVLAGFTLVFLGLVLVLDQRGAAGTHQRRLADPPSVLGLAAATVLGLVVVFLAAVYLVLGAEDTVLFHWTAALFFLQLAALALSAGWFLWRMLWSR